MEDETMVTGNNEFDAAFFDDASTAWKANKIRSGNGTYSYKCRKGSCQRKGCVRYNDMCYKCYSAKKKSRWGI